MSKKNNAATWLWVSISSALVPLVSYLVTDLVFGGRESSTDTWGQISGLVLLISLIAIVSSTIAIVKIDGKKRLIPITAVVLNLLVAGLSLYVYSFSSYGY